MDAIEQLREHVRQGRIDVDRLIDVIVSQQRQLEAARQRIGELEKKLGGPGSAAATPAKIDQPFSMRAEEKRQRDRNKNKLKLGNRHRIQVHLRHPIQVHHAGW